MLEQCDDEAYDRSVHRWMSSGGFLGILLGIPLIQHFIEHVGTEVRSFGALQPVVVQVEQYSFNFLAFVFIFCGVGALAGRMIARRRFKPKFARFTRRSYGAPIPRQFDQPPEFWMDEVKDFIQE